MKATPVYHFETYTSAKDSANMFYIQKPNATSITTDTTTKTITVLSRFHALAIFAW